MGKHSRCSDDYDLTIKCSRRLSGVNDIYNVDNIHVFQNCHRSHMEKNNRPNDRDGFMPKMQNICHGYLIYHEH